MTTSHVLTNEQNCHSRTLIVSLIRIRLEIPQPEYRDWKICPGLQIAICSHGYIYT